MTRLQKVRQMNNLEDYAEADGFEYVGDGMILVFVKKGEAGTENHVELCSNVREARKEIKTRQAAGWECC